MGCLQVKGIPFLVFDAGGVLEMFDPKEFSDNVVFEPTLAALKRKLSSVVSPLPHSSVVPPSVQRSGAFWRGVCASSAPCCNLGDFLQLCGGCSQA